MNVRVVLFSSFALGLALAACSSDNPCQEAAKLACQCDGDNATAVCAAIEIADRVPGALTPACEGNELKAAECANGAPIAEYCAGTFPTSTVAAQNSFNECVAAIAAP